MFDARATAPPLPTLLTDVKVLRDLIRLVLCSYGPLGRDSHRRSMSPAAASVWLYGPPIFQLPLSTELQFKELSPATRRNVLWLVCFSADGGEFFVRFQRTSFRTYCCRSCAWSTVIQNIEVEQHKILQKAAFLWHDELREALDRAIRAVTPKSGAPTCKSRGRAACFAPKGV